VKLEIIAAGFRLIDLQFEQNPTAVLLDQQPGRGLFAILQCEKKLM